MYSILRMEWRVVRCVQRRSVGQGFSNQGEQSTSGPVRRGRGANSNPANRFETTHHELELDQVEDDADYLDGLSRPATEFLPDKSRTVIAENDSPDVGFEVSLNPYRGCEHGCIYCYARPTHEYLGFSAGLDFETRIMVKYDARSCSVKCFHRRGGGRESWA